MMKKTTNATLKYSTPPQAVLAYHAKRPAKTERKTLFLVLIGLSRSVRKRYPAHAKRKIARGSDLNHPRFPLSMRGGETATMSAAKRPPTSPAIRFTRR